MNKRGFSLTEILITLGIMAILGSVATVSYRGYNLNAEKTNLKTSGILFAGAVQNCVSARGGWKIEKPDGTSIKLCDTKAKLDYTCPAGATSCITHVHHRSEGANMRDHYKFYCLNIEKTVSGKKLQVIVRFTWLKPSDYELWCGIMSTPIVLGPSTCRGGGTGVYTENMTGLTYPCDWK